MTDAKEEFKHATSRRIRDLAMELPETTEGSSCVNRAFKAGGRNFAFLGETEEECRLRLKLDASIPRVQALNGSLPGAFEIGKFGWTMLRFPPDEPPPTKDLEQWITESFQLLAPKKLRALLDP